MNAPIYIHGTQSGRADLFLITKYIGSKADMYTIAITLNSSKLTIYIILSYLIYMYLYSNT